MNVSSLGTQSTQSTPSNIVTSVGKNIAPSNILDTSDIIELKNNLQSYADIITGTSVFNTLGNAADISAMIYNILEDLYITQPRDAIDFANQAPSSQFVTDYFMRFGISNEYLANYPQMLKTKTAYMLNQLFMYKGTAKIYDYFNEILSEFYDGLNFYNVEVEQRHYTSTYENPIVKSCYYIKSDNTIMDSYGIQQNDATVLIDESIEFQIYVKLNTALNRVQYRFKFFETTTQRFQITLTSSNKSFIIDINLDEFSDYIMAFTPITQYDSPIIHNIYYLKNGNIDPKYALSLGTDLSTFKDLNISYKLSTTLNALNSTVTYTLTFIAPTIADILITIGDLNSIIIPEGSTTYNTTFSVSNIYTKKERNADDLRYVLKPILINSPLNLLNEVQDTDISTPNYLMTLPDFFDTDVNNIQKKNIFPLCTNVLYIQFAGANTMDTMLYLPDLVRMFSMTITQFDTFTFNFNNLNIKMPMRDYINILMYLKLKELEINTPGYEWSIPASFAGVYSNFIFPYSDVNDIYSLLTYYKDMGHDYNQFQTFKDRYYAYLGAVNQLQNTHIFNMQQFEDSLSGNIPTDFPTFFTVLNNYFPASVNIIGGVDQNEEMIKNITVLYNSYNPSTVDEFFSILSSMDTVYPNMNNTLYDMLKTKFSGKYSTLIQQLNNITTVDEIISTYLYNYKFMLTQITKYDNIVSYFVNDIYQNFMLDATFKENFFDPVVKLFNQYFFKAEQSYQNYDADLEIVKDKMQMVVLNSSMETQVQLDKYYSTHLQISTHINQPFATFKDNLMQQDNFIIDITTEDSSGNFTTITYTN